MSVADFFPLVVSQIIDETADTKTFVFDVPEHQDEMFSFVSGQYLTVKAEVNGKEERRAYSISASPILNPSLNMTVKRVPGGKISNWLHDTVKVGQTLQIMPPQGRFVFKPESGRQLAYFLVGAGSGITPLMSILQTILEAEPMSTVHLLYGNKQEDSIIFRAQLQQMEHHYANQLFVTHTLSQPAKQKAGGLGGWFKKSVMDWSGETGRIDKKLLMRCVHQHGVSLDKCRFYLCGPSALIEMCEKTLTDQGVAPQHVHREFFTVAEPKASSSAEGAVQVELYGKVHDLVVPKGKTILDVLIAEKLNPPYSCMSGACTTCIAKVVKGKVKMDSALALEQDEINAGYILTCQSHPDGPDTLVVFE